MSRTAKKQEKLPPGVVATIEELAVALGVHRRTIGSWKHKTNFPQRSDGMYHCVHVEQWRRGYRFIDEEPQEAASQLSDMDCRAEHLLKALKELQPGLLESLPEDQRERFAPLLDKAIVDAIRDSYDGECSFFREYYEGAPK